jgi:hypothetical protein
MTSSTAIATIRPDRPDISQWLDPNLAQVPGVQEESPGSSTLMVVVDATENRKDELIQLFDAWAQPFADRTPVDNEHLCQLLRLMPQTSLLVAERHAPAATKNPAEDLRRWLAPEISVPSIAAACGVSERGFYGWLAGGGIRERNARRLHGVRAIVQALMLRLGRAKTIEWMLSPRAELGLTPPIAALAEGRHEDVLRALDLSLPATAPPAMSGPRFAEDTAEHFSSEDLLLEQVDDAERRPRRRRRRR